MSLLSRFNQSAQTDPRDASQDAINMSRAREALSGLTPPQRAAFLAQLLHENIEHMSDRTLADVYRLASEKTHERIKT